MAVNFKTHVYEKRHRSGKVTWFVRWRDQVSGRWAYSSGWKSQDEAELAEADIRKSLFMGLDPRAKPATSKEPPVSELVQLYYESPRFKNSSEDWQAARRRQYNNQILPKFGKRYLSSVTKKELFAFYSNLKEKEEMAHSTIGKYHDAISILGQILVDECPGQVNPVSKIEDFGEVFPEQASTRPINFLTPDELERIFTELQNKKFVRSRALLPFIKLLAYSGMRRSEALELRWSDVDYETGFIHVRDSKTNEERQVPLEQGSIEALLF